MTLRVIVENRRNTIGDSLLRYLGKKRKPVIPKVPINDSYGKLGPFCYLVVNCRYQSVWEALWNEREECKG